jgi:hypothetical protein
MGFEAVAFVGGCSSPVRGEPARRGSGLEEVLVTASPTWSAIARVRAEMPLLAD